MRIGGAALLALAGLAGCSIFDGAEVDDFSGDPFPIRVDTSTGAIMIGARETGRTHDFSAVIDLMSPLTLLDPGTGVTPIVTSSPLDLLGADASGALVVPRAHLSGPRLIELHPCADDDCTVGTGATTATYDMLIGGDALAGDAIRLSLADDQIFVLADVAGDEQHRARFCDAVFPSPYRGGGTMIIAGTELGFASFRPVLGACIAPDPDPGKLQSQRGADALFVASTSVGISILGQSAYERFRAEQIDAPGGQPLPVNMLPMDSVVLPSGPVLGHRTTLPSIALVAASGTGRPPCRQVYAHHLLAESDCGTGIDCPCNTSDTFCAVPGIAELAPAAGIDVLVVTDDNPTLQALRTELRPDQAEVDGILGTQAMRVVQIDADYPHDRILMRCTPGNTECTIRPELIERVERTQVLGCVGGSGSGGPIQ